MACVCRCRGNGVVLFQIIRNPALEGCGWSTPRSGLFTPGKTRYQQAGRALGPVLPDIDIYTHTHRTRCVIIGDPRSLDDKFSSHKCSTIDTIEQYYIYADFAQNNHLNDDHTISPRKIFKALLKPYQP